MPSPSTFSAPISDRRSGRARLLVLGAAFVLPLLFATYTGHIWEDFYITFRISKNLVAGHGLVFQPGERVHTFTSPLGVLIPALCSWLTGANNDQAAVWLFRLISAGFLAATADLLWRIARQLQLARPGLALLFGLFLFDAKIADFSMNGMETALLVFFFAWTIRALVTGPVTPWRLGVGLGGLMWTRPDGFVFGGALLAGFLWFVWRTRPATEWRGLGTGLARAAAIAGILYLPWFAWAWWYYGSPIPQTILAKSALNISHDFFHTLTTYPFHLLMGTSRVSGLFMPTYHYFGGWPDELGAYSILLTFPAVGYFFVPRAHPIGRALSFALFLGGAYLQIAPPEPWYNQVWQVLAMIVLAIVVTDAVRLFAWLSATSGTAIRYCSRLRIAVGILLVVQVSLWACAAIQMRINQREIEEGMSPAGGTLASRTCEERRHRDARAAGLHRLFQRFENAGCARTLRARSYGRNQVRRSHLAGNHRALAARLARPAPPGNPADSIGQSRSAHIGLSARQGF